jgi:hypothetical protein
LRSRFFGSALLATITLIFAYLIKPIYNGIYDKGSSVEGGSSVSFDASLLRVVPATAWLGIIHGEWWNNSSPLATLLSEDAVVGI